MMPTENDQQLYDYSFPNANRSVEDSTQAQSVATEPVFLVGAERSGSTLLRLMLDHHPKLSFRGEFEFAVDEMTDDGQFPALEAYYEYLSTQRAVHLSKLVIDKTLDYPHLVDTFLRWRQATDHKPLVGATVHRNFHRLPYVWPKARYIHLCRDGRDVAQSVVLMGWAGNVYHGTEWWSRAFHEWQHLRRHLKSDQYMELTYEDLVHSPRTELERICEFIGVAYSDAMLEYPKHTTYGLPDGRLSQQWRKKMSPTNVRRIEAKLGTMLQERGYELSGFPHLEISRWKHLLLMLDSRCRHVADRFRRFGPRLYLGELIARRLGLRSLARRFRLGMNEILDREMK